MQARPTVLGISITVLLWVLFGPGAWTEVRAGKVDEVRIGNILPLSGPSANAGRQCRAAIELATDAINAAGGIKSLGGARLVNVWADSRGEAAFGITAAEQLITTDKVAVISGAWNSAVTYPTTQVAEKARVPYVVPVSVRDSITERGFKYTFRIAPKDSWRSRDQFRFLKDMRKAGGTKIETVAFVFEDGPWGTSMRDQWARLVASDGYKVVLAVPYASTAGDMTETALKIRNARPDVVLLASFTQDAALLAVAMSALNVRVKAVVASGGGHSSPAFLKRAGKACEYVFDTSGWEPDMNRPQIVAINAEFRKRTGFDLSAETVDAFASVYVIANALEEAESIDPGDIRNELADTDLCRGEGRPGIDILAYRCIEFDKTGQNENAGYVVTQFRDVNGTMERVTVWPKDAARKGFVPVFPAP
jgi:branched-chain amino acid transport system substrate-binding protein